MHLLKHPYEHMNKASNYPSNNVSPMNISSSRDHWDT